MYIWYSQINNINIDDSFLLINYLKLDNSNFINIIFLFGIEITYYLWSFISNKNNLSDWIVQKPLRIEILNGFKIVFFYLFAIVYYSILE